MQIHNILSETEILGTLKGVNLFTMHLLPKPYTGLNSFSGKSSPELTLVYLTSLLKPVTVTIYTFH